MKEITKLLIKNEIHKCLGIYNPNSDFLTIYDEIKIGCEIKDVIKMGNDYKIIYANMTPQLYKYDGWNQKWYGCEI